MKLSALIPKFGLTGRFISWFLLVSMVPIILIAYFSSSRAESALEQAATEKIASVSELAEINIISIINEDLLQIKALATNELFHIEATSDEQKQKIQTNLELIFKELPEYYEVFILNNQGTVIASSDKSNLGQNKSTDDYFIGANQTSKAYLKDVYYSSTTNQYGYAVSTQLIDPATQTNYGVIVARVKIDKIANFLSELSGRTGQTADFFLINSEGKYISNPRFADDSLPLLPAKRNSNLDNCINGVESEDIADNYQEIETINSYRSKHFGVAINHNWCLVGQISMNEIDQPISALRNLIYIISTIIAAIVLFVALYASRSISNFIKKPIKKAADLLGKTSIALSASTQQAASSAQQNASIAQQVASGAVKQSDQATSVVNTMTQMSNSIKQMGVSITTVMQSAENASSMAQEAGNSGEQSKSSLSKMRDVIANSTTMVKEVANKSQSIGNIVQTITEIAEQTNLLSLNASIEAARAGEAGRGFAVVATEVKDLSEEAKKSALEIGNLVKDMLANIDETVVASEESNRTVDESTKVIEQTLAKLQNITTSMMEVSSKIQDVSAVIQQQSAAVDTVSSNINQVSSLAQQSASGAQQLSASVQQQSAINQQVAAASQQLLSLSTDLQDLVGKTKSAISSYENKQAVEVPKIAQVSKPMQDHAVSAITHMAENTQQTISAETKKTDETTNI